MDMRYVVVATGLAVLLAISGRAIARLWRHRTNALDRRPSWWPGDERSWRGWLRTLPSATAFLAILFVGIALGPLVPEQPPDAFGFVRPAWYSLPLAAAPVIATLLWISIYFFNRPQFFVPPHLRDDHSTHK
jgi:hypothetical protein